jgi:nucleotide-binding universal stress UspA family protein
MAAKPIVAGTDGSEESLRAVDWAAMEAALRGAPLRIVAAAALLPRMAARVGTVEYDTVTDVLLKERDRALAAAAERATRTAPGLLIDSDPLDGQPAQAVTESGTGAQMLVLGSRGIGAFTALLLDEWRTKYPDVPVSQEVVHGHPGRTLVGLSARADLVVVGRHAKHPGLPGAGSVRHAVLNHAHGPVVTVPSTVPA